MFSIGWVAICASQNPQKHSTPNNGRYYLKNTQDTARGTSMANIKERTSKAGVTTFQVQIRRKGYPPIIKNFDTLKDVRDWTILTEAIVLKNEAINPWEATKWTIPDLIDWYIKNPNEHRKLKTKKHFNRLYFLQDLLRASRNLWYSVAWLATWRYQPFLWMGKSKNECSLLLIAKLQILQDIKRWICWSDILIFVHQA